MPLLGDDGRQLSGATKRRRYGYRKPPRPWCFIDTEGAHDPAGVYGVRGRQWCWLITAADRGDWQRHLITGRPLGTAQLLAFVCDLPAKFKLGAYGFGYDIDQILHELAARDLLRLHQGGLVCWRGFAIRRFANRLSVARLGPRGVKLHWRPVWDVVRFYRGRLSDVTREWKVAEPAEQELIEEMKAERGDFSLDYWRCNRDRLISYSLLENRLAARLQTRFDQLSRDLGYPLSAWYGAGSMAAAMMRSEGVRAHLDKRRPIRTVRFRRALPWTYYGGRFEIRGPGEYAPIHEYDLASAYPAACRELPCLIHSRWRLHREPPALDPVWPRDKWSLFTVQWAAPDGRWGPFPLRRRSGTVYYPLSGSSIVWGVELWPAQLLHPVGVYAGAPWWEHVQNCDCQPFEWIERVYRERVALGKDRRGYPLKLGLNSCYGKLASTLGQEPGEGLSGWCEPRWASQITAWTRAQLLFALYHAGGASSESVIMFATDAIYSTKKIRLPNLGDGLGEWSEQSYERGLLVQPGIYFLSGRAHLKRRGRGLAQADIERAKTRFYRAWRRDGPAGSVEIVTEPRYQSVRLALHRNRDLSESAWRWEPETRRISFYPLDKRVLARPRPGRPASWLPAPNEERFERLFDTRPVHYPHTPFAVLFGVGLEGAPPPVAADQVEQEILDSDQPRVQLGD